MAIHVEIIGGIGLQAKLKALGPALGKQVRKDMERAMRPLLRRAIDEAPKDTGNLADHITPESEAKGANVSSSVVVDDVPYGPKVELGVPALHRPPDPFLLRAVDAEGNAALSNATRSIAGTIEREARA